MEAGSTQHAFEDHYCLSRFYGFELHARAIRSYQTRGHYTIEANQQQIANRRRVLPLANNRHHTLYFYDSPQGL